MSDEPDRRVTYWIELADYDLETARVMLDGRRYLYVGFMCHQVIEKALKGYTWHVKQAGPEYTHSLARLLRDSDLMEELSEQTKELVDLLEPLNIEARYPSDKERLLKSMTRKRSAEILQRTKELFEWIKNKLSNS